jgi:hypothetical protein
VTSEISLREDWWEPPASAGGAGLFFEGYGLQPVHKRLKTGTALAAEGRISIRLQTFSAASLMWDAKNLNVPAPTLQPRFARLPPNFNIFLRSTRTRIQRRLQIRRQHSVSRSATNRTRFRL